MKKGISTLIHNDNLIFTFIRAQFSSALSALVDLSMRVFCYSFLFYAFDEFYRSNTSVAIGAILGGIVQCCVNYKFTFHASGQNIKAIAFKFFLVFLGNILLNMYGTTFIFKTIISNNYLVESFTQDFIFACTTFAVAIIVSVIWNFPMQRYFVFR